MKTTPILLLLSFVVIQLNEIKAANHPKIAAPLSFASDEVINNAIGASPGSLGVVDLDLYTIVDHDAASLSNFSCGANENDFHYINTNWDRDANYDEVFDLRNVVEGDLSPDGEGRLEIKRGIEVGHIFQLGKKYSETMGATVLNEQGKAIPMTMGCYGIGITRIVAAAIEQNHDDWGIIWPDAIAPFELVITPIGYNKSEQVTELCDSLYAQLQELGIEVLLDDRKERPGIMFADADLIGMPHRIVIGEKSLANEEIEYKCRRNANSQNIAQREIVDFLKAQILGDRS